MTIDEALALAKVHHHAGQLAQAEPIYREILHVDPRHGEALALLGVLAHQAGQHEQARASMEEAIQCDPRQAFFHSNLGVVYQTLGRIDEAIACYRQALFLQPENAEAHNNLGNVFLSQGKLDEAAGCYRQALHLRPDYADALHNLANVFQHLGKLDDAMRCCQEAVRLRLEDAAAHLQRAVFWLAQGDFARGWAEYEWRWQRPAFAARRLGQPRWDGSPLKGRTILLQSEQGLGDTIQFIRYAPMVRERGGTVVVECQPPLLSLIATCQGIDRVRPADADPGTCDLHVPLLSLPLVLGTTLANVPAEVPYLFAEASLVERWGKELSTFGPGLRIGIVWQGNARYSGNRQRSIPLTQFAPLAHLEGVRLFSLQVGPGTEQLADAGAPQGIVDLGSRFDPGSFADAAAVLKNLDLLISSDTAAPHLAGALGVPVWLALSVGPDWRWLLDREDSPWYPSMRLFRQQRRDDWADVFQRIAAALRQRLTTRGHSHDD